MTQTVRDTKRDAQIDSIHGLADWLAANPNVPVPTLSLYKHLHDKDGSEVENLATVRRIAANLGVDPDEAGDDRTVLRFKVNDHVWYELFAWHRAGRDKVGELDRLRAEVERLRAERTGLAYSRTDDDPQPTAGREPLHTGAVTNEGLVDEEPF